MTPAEQKLISLLLPNGILEYFELTEVGNVSKELQVFLQEKNTPPLGYKKEELESESKGVLPEVVFRISPYLEIKWPYVSNGGAEKLKVQARSLPETGI